MIPSDWLTHLVLNFRFNVIKVFCTYCTYINEHKILSRIKRENTGFTVFIIYMIYINYDIHLMCPLMIIHIFDIGKLYNL